MVQIAHDCILKIQEEEVEEDTLNMGDFAFATFSKSMIDFERLLPRRSTCSHVRLPRGPEGSRCPPCCKNTLCSKAI